MKVLSSILTYSRVRPSNQAQEEEGQSANITSSEGREESWRAELARRPRERCHHCRQWFGETRTIVAVIVELIVGAKVDTETIAAREWSRHNITRLLHWFGYLLHGQTMGISFHLSDLPKLTPSFIIQQACGSDGLSIGARSVSYGTTQVRVSGSQILFIMFCLGSLCYSAY